MSKPSKVLKWKPRIWSITRAIKFCQDFQKYLDDKNTGITCAMTGSCLFKGSSKKDLDIVLFPNKTSDRIKEMQVLEILGDYGFDILEYRTKDHPGDTKPVWAYRGPIGRIDFFLLSFS